jgi:cholesterol oxidase
MPGPVGANPSLTIAAFADRCADHLIEQGERRRGTAAHAPTSAPQVVRLPEPRSDTATGLEFTEEMKGYLTLGETDPHTGYDVGRREHTPFMFHLTIRTDDVDRFLAEPGHLGTAEGWIECPTLGGRRPVAAGDFNLFVADGPGQRRMTYRLFFTDAAGHPLTLSGYKVVRDDPGLDVWPDTSTLYSRVLVGHVSAEQEASAVVTGAGILHIHLRDFAQQMTTFRTSGGGPVERVRALASFGRFFMGELWDVYTAKDASDSESEMSPTGGSR